MTTITVANPPKLRRLTRRTTWRCRVEWHKSDERFRRAGTMRVAAQAVALHHFIIPLRRVNCDADRGFATLDADWRSLAFSLRDARPDARYALERDCIAILAGVVARAFALGWEHTTYGWNDQELVCDLLDRLEYDEGVRTSWYFYQLERARVFVSAPAVWTQIELLAARLRQEPVMDALRVAEVLADVHPEQIIVPAQISWRETESSGRSDVVLVWEPPGLTEIVARALARRYAEEGDDQ